MVKKESLNVDDSIMITTPIGKIQIMINVDGVEFDLSKPEALISVKINGTNVASNVQSHGNRNRGNSQQVQVINGSVRGGQISQSGGDTIQIQTNRYR